MSEGSVPRRPTFSHRPTTLPLAQETPAQLQVSLDDAQLASSVGFRGYLERRGKEFSNDVERRGVGGVETQQQLS